MSRAEQQDDRVGYLLRLLCDDKLDGEEATELAELLATSESAQRRYIEHVQLCTDLADWSSATVPISIPYRALANGINDKASEHRLTSAPPEEDADSRKL